MEDQLFEFVKEEKDGNDYVFTFETTSEIVDILKEKYGDNFEEVLSRKFCDMVTLWSKVSKNEKL